MNDRILYKQWKLFFEMLHRIYRKDFQLKYNNCICSKSYEERFLFWMFSLHLIRMLSKEPEKRLTASELLEEFSQVGFEEVDFPRK